MSKKQDKAAKPHPAKEENKKDAQVKAKEAAERDLNKDPEFSAHSPNDDLDEEETARLGDGKNDLV